MIHPKEDKISCALLKVCAPVQPAKPKILNLTVRDWKQEVIYTFTHYTPCCTGSKNLQTGSKICYVVTTIFMHGRVTIVYSKTPMGKYNNETGRANYLGRVRYCESWLVCVGFTSTCAEKGRVSLMANRLYIRRDVR